MIDIGVERDSIAQAWMCSAELNVAGVHVTGHNRDLPPRWYPRACGTTGGHRVSTHPEPPRSNPESEAVDGSSTPRIFINHRHTDGGWAHLLYDRLANRFGKSNVFLDAVSLKPGIQWLEELRTQSSTCSAFIALIGPNWASMMSDRAKGSEKDHARAEIERALRRDSAVRKVIPALVGDAEQPSEKDLPSLRSLFPLLHRQWKELRPSTWDEDVEALVREIEAIELSPRFPPAPSPPPRPSALPPNGGAKPEGDRWAPRPNRRQFG